MTTDKTVELENVVSDIAGEMRKHNCSLKIMKATNGKYSLLLVDNDNAEEYVFAQAIPVKQF